MDDPTTPPAAARCEFPRPADLMRDADRWAKTNAETVSEGSRAQVIHCIRDALCRNLGGIFGGLSHG